MVSTAPVSSPTPSICTTMGGNTACFSSGPAMLSPSLTLSWTSVTARLMTTLLTVSETMSRDWRMGTRDRNRTERVLANRDRACLWNRLPKMGTRSLSASTAARPAGVFFHLRNRKTSTMVAPITMYQ